MKKENWNVNTNNVRLWAEGQEDSQQIQAIMLSLTLGDSAPTDELRSTYWTAIRSIGSTMENFPQARRGRESALTETQEIVLATVENQVRSAFASIPTNYHQALLTVIVPHGRTGGVYADFDAFVESQVKSAHNYILQSMKDNRVMLDKEGEFVLKDDMLQIEPRPTKADKEGEEEE